MKHLATGLEIVSAILLGATIVAAFAGPLRFDILGMTLSLRTLSRPLIAALILLAMRAWLLRGAELSHAGLSTASRVLLGAFVAAGVTGWMTFLSSTCGGADSYGYVSAADRLLSGTVVQAEPLATVLPFPDGIAAACPLGYVPAGRMVNASAPAYPLGLPLLMAAARTMLGSGGPFVVAPLMGLVLLWAAYLTADAWYGDRETALLACALVALNPLVFTYSIQPMSDIPAAAALTAAVAALSRRAPWPLVAGLAAGAALLVRPSLAPVAVALAAVPVAVAGWRGSVQAARYLIAIVAAVVVQGWTQWYLYGDPLSSGYGGIADLFSVQTAAINLRSYGYWGFHALGPVWLGALAIGLSLGHRLPRVVTGLVIAGVGLPYLFYRPYDHWETLRFLLPAIVMATLVAAAGLLAIARRLVGLRAGAAVAAVMTVLMASAWMSWLSAHQVFRMPEHEARYRLAGELVALVTPQNAVVLALQHSGSIRYYARRQTVNWERIPAGAFAATVQALQGHGLGVYLLIDSAEERALLEAKHGPVVADGAWLPSGQRRNVQLYEAPKRVRQVR